MPLALQPPCLGWRESPSRLALELRSLWSFSWHGLDPGSIGRMGRLCSRMGSCILLHDFWLRNEHSHHNYSCMDPRTWSWNRFGYWHILSRTGILHVCNSRGRRLYIQKGKYTLVYPFQNCHSQVCRQRWCHMDLVSRGRLEFDDGTLKMDDLCSL